MGDVWRRSPTGAPGGPIDGICEKALPLMVLKPNLVVQWWLDFRFYREQRKMMDVLIPPKAKLLVMKVSWESGRISCWT